MRTVSSHPTFRHYRPAPGHPDWARLFAEARALAEAVAPELEEPRRGLRELRRRAASARTAAANFRENRRRARRGREDLLPLYFIWTTTRACNFRCTYCDDHQGRRYPELPQRGMLDLARGKRLLEVMRSRTPSVYFAGGEPTARADLPALTRHAYELDYWPIVVNTNGSLVERNLKKPAWRTWLADTDLVVVSLDGLEVERLARLWVFDRPLEVLRNLLVLRELSGPMRFKLAVNCVIEPGRADEARAVFALCRDLGLWFAPVPQNVGPRIAPGLVGEPGYEAFVDELLAAQRSGARLLGSPRMNARLLRAAPLDCRNSLKPHVDHDGHLTWPCKSSQNVAPERVDVLAFDGVDALYARACELVDTTRFHGPAKNQCGADCNWAQNYSTDAYVHGLLHPLSLVSDVASFVRTR
jgi:MoaA/NifB/PqqE/SkfB family radical SAM enzyme